MYNMELPKVIVDRQQLSAMQLRRKQFTAHEAMELIAATKAFWKMEEKFELDVYLLKQMREMKEKNDPVFIRTLRFWKWVSRATKAEVKEQLQRGRTLAEADLYGKTLAELMEHNWPCTCSDQRGGRAFLKADILILLMDAQGKIVACALGYHITRIKEGHSGRHNMVIVYSHLPGTAKTTTINGVYGTVLADMIFQPSYKSGFVFRLGTRAAPRRTERLTRLR